MLSATRSLLVGFSGIYVTSGIKLGSTLCKASVVLLLSPVFMHLKEHYVTR